MELFVIEKCNSPLGQLQETGWPVWEKKEEWKPTEKQNKEEGKESYKTLYIKHVDSQWKVSERRGGKWFNIKNLDVIIDNPVQWLQLVVQDTMETKTKCSEKQSVTRIKKETELFPSPWPPACSVDGRQSALDL